MNNRSSQTSAIESHTNDKKRDNALEALKLIHDATWHSLEIFVEKSDKTMKLTVAGIKHLNTGILTSALHIGKALADGKDLKAALANCVPELEKEVIKDLTEKLMSAATLKPLGLVGSKFIGILVGDILFSDSANPNEHEWVIEMKKKGLNTTGNPIQPRFPSIAMLNEKIESHYQKGRDLCNKENNHLAALNQFNTVLAVKENHWGALYYRGWCYQAKGGALQKAISEYEQALKFKNDFYDIYYQQGMCHLMLKEYEKALLDFNQTLKLYPTYATGYYRRSCVHFNLGDFKHADEDIKEAIRLSPTHPDFKKFQETIQLKLLPPPKTPNQTFKEAWVAAHQAKLERLKKQEEERAAFYKTPQGQEQLRQEQIQAELAAQKRALKKRNGLMMMQQAQRSCAQASAYHHNLIQQTCQPVYQPPYTQPPTLQQMSDKLSQDSKDMQEKSNQYFNHAKAATNRQFDNLIHQNNKEIKQSGFASSNAAFGQGNSAPSKLGVFGSITQGEIKNEIAREKAQEGWHTNTHVNNGNGGGGAAKELRIIIDCPCGDPNYQPPCCKK